MVATKAALHFTEVADRFDKAAREDDYLDRLRASIDTSDRRERGSDAGFQGHFAAPPAGPDDGYPDSIDKTHTTPESTPDEKAAFGQLSFEKACPGFASVGDCKKGHTFVKVHICGKEWCQYCGKTDGKAHKRRKARWLPKARQIETMGYIVITIPPEIRWQYRTKPALSALGTAFKRMLQRHGFDRGLRGWDWFGECPGHKNTEVKDCLCPRQYHPHFSALVDGGYRDPGQLVALKQSVANILGVAFGRVNVYWQFSSDVPRMLHWTGYVLRPTFLDAKWDEEQAVELYGFRTYSVWGGAKRWAGPPVWGEAPEGSPGVAVEALVAGKCPHDGTPITWSPDVIPAVLVADPEFWEDLGAGFKEYVPKGETMPKTYGQDLDLEK